MSLSKNRTFFQFSLSKNTKLLLQKYCELFSISQSQFCEQAVTEKLLTLILTGAKSEKIQS